MGVPEVSWILRRARSRSSLSVWMIKVRRRIELFLVVHLVVSLLEELVMLFLIILRGRTCFPSLELPSDFLVAFVDRFLVLEVFLGCGPTMPSRPASLPLLTFFLVHIIQVLFCQGEPGFVCLESFIRIRQLLELSLVSRFLHIWMVDFRKLQVRTLQVSLRKSRRETPTAGLCIVKASRGVARRLSNQVNV